jgi:hypothetical protein
VDDGETDPNDREDDEQAPTDADNDGLADEVDNCPTVPNADQIDDNDNGVGDACDEALVGEPCEVGDGDGACVLPGTYALNPQGALVCVPDETALAEVCDGQDNDCDGEVDEDLGCDDDADGVLVDDDNCPELANPDQADDDGDGTGDACEDDDGDGLVNGDDNCPMVDNADQADEDGDNAGDACDNCAGLSNPDQVDSDDNGAGDACDPDEGSGSANSGSLRGSALFDCTQAPARPNLPLGLGLLLLAWGLRRRR